MTEQLTTIAKALDDILRTRRATGEKITAARLSIDSNVDQSLIRKWMRGERVPRPGSASWIAMTKALKLTAEEQRTLDNAWFAALKEQRTADVDTVRRVDSAAAVWNLVQASNTMAPPESPGTGSASAATERVLTLLENAGERPGRGRSIWMTFQTHSWGISPSTTLRERWRSALRRCLENGWKIRDFVRVDNDLARSVGVADDVLVLVDGLRSYTPRYLLQSGDKPALIDLVYVEDFRALLLVAGTATGQADGAIEISHTEALGLRPFFQALEDDTRSAPLFDVKTKDEEIAWNRAILAAETPAGGKRLAKYGPSAVTRPRHWYDPGGVWEITLRMPPENVEELCEIDQKRIDAFLRNVKTSPYRDVYLMRAFDDLGNDETSGEEPALADRLPERLTSEQQVEWIENIIRLHREYENYSIGLLSPEQEHLLPSSSFWEVLGDREALFDVRRRGDEKFWLGLVLKERSLSRGLRQFFDRHIWERIEPTHREKKWVSWWLSERAKAIREGRPPESHST